MTTLLLLILTAYGQANVPAVARPELITISPGLKKAVEDVQEQCPTCATIDIRGGKQTWLSTVFPNQTTGSQIDVPDGCALTQWTQNASRDLKAAQSTR